MNLNIIVFSVLISFICILLAFIHHYFNSQLRLTSLRRAASGANPLFGDLIISPRDFAAIDYAQDSIAVVREPYTKGHSTTTEAEIEQCLRAALAYKKVGKLEKAFKLYKYASHLAPENANVLNKYGEFLEEYRNDILTANKLYNRALTYDPIHKAALSNCKRTAGIVDQFESVIFNEIEAKRDLLKLRVHSSLNMEKKKRAFYLHIYHTVGIEGNTMNLEQLQYLLETGNVVHGKSIVEHNEVLGIDTALRYLKILANAKYIEISDILDIHKRVMGYTDPVTSGAFRNEQMFVASHVPPPPEDLEKLMEAYTEWLNSEEALSMHPIRLAALAHYKLVEIHPFADGNGRTSRLIMNLILLRSGYPPVMIYKEDRSTYYDSLTTANKGDVRPFVRFIAYCTEETLNTYLGLNQHLNVGTKQLSASKIIEVDGLEEI